jgi:hypothetical protein
MEELFDLPTYTEDFVPSADLEKQPVKIFKVAAEVGVGAIAGSFITDWVMKKQSQISPTIAKVGETILGVLFAAWAAKKENADLFYIGTGIAVDGIRGLLINLLPKS